MNGRPAVNGAGVTSHQPSVLIVEDVPALAESYSAFLSREPVTVHTVGSGQQALWPFSSDNLQPSRWSTSICRT